MRRTFVLLGVALCACGSDPGARETGGGSPADQALAQREAAELGRDVFDLVDRAMDYQGSHRGRPPATFRELGIDTLTARTVRRLSHEGGVPTVTVAFRRTEGRALVSCSGTSAVLEEASLNGDRFSVACATVDGRRDTFHVTR